MRLLFLGSGEFGIPTLRQLAADYDVAAVVTQPDRPAGRNRKLTPTPVAAWAAEKKMTVIKTEDVNEPSLVEDLRKLGADASVVIAFGQKLGEPLIGAMGGLAINLHASLLPSYRGAAPINWAIINGEQVTGVSVIGLAQKMDAGVIYARAATPINPHEIAGELHDRLALLGPDLVTRVLDHFKHHKLKPEPQDDAKATKAPKLSKADAWVDFSASAQVVRRRIHGLNPWPGVKAAWVNSSGNVQMEITLRRAEAQDISHDASPGMVINDGCIACGHGVLRILELQPPGGRPMSMEQFTNGHAIAPGDRFVSPVP